MDQMYKVLKQLRHALAARDGECHKRPYRTREEAEDAARGILRSQGAQRYAYVCWCGLWHLTSSKPKSF